MATSRRRERELARRRYERRRLREMERRAKQRRRNTILGASLGTAAVIAGIVVLAIHLAGGSDKSKATALTTPTPVASTSATPPPDPCANAKPTAAQLHPKMPKVGGKAPSKLVVKDLTPGSGTAAKAGDTLCVTYVGADYKTGKVFDASYKHGGTPFAVTPLGSASVIKGWNQGLIGVKSGAVRELVIPPALGYGPSGQPPTIKPNETLIFLVSVTAVKSA